MSEPSALKPATDGWELQAHVRPINDLIEHDFDVGCVCVPTVEETNDGEGFVVIHNSLDGRELLEDE